ncbi:MAG: 6,7-dimethyl-8-ribityllumazine synthase [Phycisphaeraceae bacterium]
MPKVIEGKVTADKLRLGIVVARFNSFITDKLLEGALGTITRHGGDAEAVTVVHVPGSLELGVTAKQMAASGRFDAVICLGCVIQGATAHYDCVVQGTTQGITQAAMETGRPVIFGVLTCETLEQAIERSGSKMGNAGASAALAAIEMSHVMKQISAGEA